MWLEKRLLERTGADPAEPQVDAFNAPVQLEFGEIDELTVPAVTRPLNRRFCVLFVVALACAAAGVHLLHGWQVARMAAASRARAEAAEQHGDLSAAAVQWRQYLALNEEDAVAPLRLAQVLDAAAKTPQERYDAYVALERALRRHPHNSEARLRVVDLAVSFDRLPAAITHLEYHLTRHPDDADARRRLGSCLVASGKLERAAATFAAVIADHPTDFATCGRLAFLLRDRLDRPGDADTQIRDMLARHPDSAAAYVVAAEYQQACGLTGEALVNARRADHLAPDSPAVLRLITTLFTARPKTNEAEFFVDSATLRNRVAAALESRPEDADVLEAQARLDLLDGRPAEAERRLRRALAADGGPSRLLSLLTEALLAQNEPAKAWKAVDAFERTVASLSAADFLQARIEMHEGRWLAAQRRLEAARPALLAISPFRQQVDLELARCCAALGQSDRELAVLQQGVRHVPGSLPLERAWADALLRAGRFEELHRVLRDLPGGMGDQLLHARLLFQQNLSLLPAERNWRELAEILARPRTTGRDAEFAVLRARVLSAKDQTDAGLTLLQQFCESSSHDLEPWLVRVELAQRTAQPSQALDILSAAEQAFGRHPRLTLARAQYWAGAGGPEAASTVADVVRPLLDEPDVDREVFCAAAAACERVGREEDAVALLDTAAGRFPDNVRIKHERLRLALAAHDDATARQLVQDIRRIDGEHGTETALAAATAALAAVRSNDRRELQRLRDDLKRLGDRIPDSRPLLVLRSQLFERIGDDDSALNFALLAIERGERHPDLLRGALQRLQRQQRHSDVRRLVHRLAGTIPAIDRRAFARLAAGALVRAGEPDEAVAWARRGIAAEPSDPHDRIWLAEILSAAEQADEAERVLRTATEAEDAGPAVWIALAHHLASTRHAEAVEKLMAEAETRLDAPPAAFVRAQCLEMLGRSAEAEVAYGAALRQAPADSQVVEAFATFHLTQGRSGAAEPLLRAIVADRDATAEQRAGARRALALVLSGRQTAAAFQEALRLIDENLEGERPGTEDRCAKGRVLLSRPNPARLRDAVRLMEAQGISSRDADDQVLLAELYLALDDWTQARDALVGLIFSDGATPEHLAFAIDALLTNGEQGGTLSRAMEALERQQPGRLQTTLLKARTLAAQQDHDGALDLLTRQLPPGTEWTSSDVGRALDVAAACTQAGLQLQKGLASVASERFFQQAETIYRDVQTRDPNQMLHLAAFLRTRWRLPEAFALCRNAWSVCPAEAVAAECLRLLRTGKATAADFQQVEAELRTALTTAERPAELQRMLGEILERAEDAPAAVAAYEAAFQLDPDDWLAAAAWGRLIALTSQEPADLDRATAVMNDRIEQFGPEPALLESRALLHLRRDRTAEALDDLQQAVADLPTPMRRIHLAQAQVAAGELLAAQRSHEDALRGGLAAGDVPALEREGYGRLQALFDESPR